ncbi:protein of unknown function [Flagellimonas flava]|uniref:DUF4249 domain-containing protein n=2 Tax=Flagellimonas flava TaxID=570519 RepID=A0A1M5I1G9_9FLAO|nr:protein of unknown function [Allomuricauda flava]
MRLSPIQVLFRFFKAILMLAFLAGCVESFEPGTEVFEDALVIESTITDEMGRQEVVLSRAFRFEEFVPEPEQGAKVMVVDDSGNEFAFEETTAGRYTSNVDFAAEQGRSYQLLITTSSGDEYASEQVVAPERFPIGEISAGATEENGGGIDIFVDYEPSQAAKYFRYKYEETYKIIAPDWNSQMLAFEGPVLVLKARILDEKTCFNTNLSQNININNPRLTTSNSVPRFSVRFIQKDNYIISHRYSILVKQLVLTEASYNYFEQLQEANEGDDVFSPSQPGFFRGNVFSVNKPEENVLGFFHVASISSERLFFDYVDFYPEEALPPYVDKCFPFVPPLEPNEEEPSIGELMDANAIRYHSITATGKFAVVPRVCGDCTVLGSTEIPEFWEE